MLDNFPISILESAGLVGQAFRAFNEMLFKDYGAIAQLVEH